MSSRALSRLVLTAALAVLLAACGDSEGGGLANPKEGGTERAAPVLGGKAEEPEAAEDLGFPAFATKNTTRVGGTDPVATAAGIAQAVFPSRSPETRPAAVTLVDRKDWRGGISAAQLMSRPVRAPILLTDGDEIPPATQAALDALEPTGAKEVGGAQVLRIGDAARPEGLKVRDVPGSDYAALARAADRLQTRAAGKPSPAVLVAPADKPEFAMSAAGYAAKTGTPVLWTQGRTVPPETRAAIRDHGANPRIYLLGPASAIPDSVATGLERVGRVERIEGPDAVSTAVAFARYAKGGFGWNATDPGHGFVFASASRPIDAAGAAPLSASGTYGPLLVVTRPASLDKPVENYLLDVQPGYDSDPVRGVYNHGWLVGDESALSVDVQARIDALLEIQPVDRDQ